MLLYTDGVTEAMNPEGKLYTVERLEGILAAHGALAPSELMVAIDADIARHAAGAEQNDDVTLIAMRRKPL
jgi:sigma-B regulation protein RsbU (phosphoserine phosphatase)